MATQKKGAVSAKTIRWIWLICFAPIALVAVMMLLAAVGAFGRMPSFEELENPKSNLATEIYSEDGKDQIADLGWGDEVEAGSYKLVVFAGPEWQEEFAEKGAKGRQLPEGLPGLCPASSVLTEPGGTATISEYAALHPAPSRYRLFA